MKTLEEINSTLAEINTTTLSEKQLVAAEKYLSKFIYVTLAIKALTNAARRSMDENQDRVKLIEALEVATNTLAQIEAELV